jgi:serine/threonine-protein kinase HipA
MVFNVTISNRDDHAKNFSFQYENGIWMLSPAYDLLPSSGFNGYHITTINGQGDPSLKDIMQVATESGLTKKHAEMIIEQVIETCRKHNKLNYFLK